MFEPTIIPCSSHLISEALQVFIRRYLDEAMRLQSLSFNTLKNYQSSAKKYLSWCAANHLVAVPAATDTAEKYVKFLMRGSWSKSTVEANLRGSIVFLHQAAGIDYSLPKIVMMNIRGGTRTGALKHAKQSEPIVWDDIKRFMSEVDYFDYSDMVGLVGIMVAYDTACRIEEALSLRLDDMEIQEDGSAVIKLAKSKQDQNRVGTIKYLSKTTTGHVIRFHQTFGLRGPWLICKQSEKHNKEGANDFGFTYQGWCYHFERFALKHNIPEDTTTHAMRIGFANDARASEKISDVDAASYIGWQGQSALERYRYYTRKMGVKNGAAAKMANILGH